MYLHKMCHDGSRTSMSKWDSVWNIANTLILQQHHSRQIKTISDGQISNSQIGMDGDCKVWCSARVLTARAP
jgi:hypothetical protein